MANVKSSSAKRSSSRLDVATLLGLVVAVGGILAGFILEGGAVKEVLQPTAAMIVFGGTFGAVLVTTPLRTVIRGVKALMSVFVERSESPGMIVEEVINYATKARKNGIVSLEQDAAVVADPFLRKALNLAVDGTDLQEIRKMMELEMTLEEHHTEAIAKVFESAGGYAPTIGIIGAVMGLMQVMKNLADIDEVGRGIATAFVATIYGLVLANLLCLPAGAKIRTRGAASIQMKELMLEGVSGIVEGLNPKLIRTKLEAYVPKAAPGKVKGAKAAKT